MVGIETLAKELQMRPSELLKESLKTYLEKRLAKVEAEYFFIAKRHGVKDVFDLDKKFRSGRLGEKDAFPDYFALDHLEAERKKIRLLLRRI